MNTAVAESYVSGLFKHLSNGNGYLYAGEGPGVSHTYLDEDLDKPAHHIK